MEHRIHLEKGMLDSHFHSLEMSRRGINVEEVLRESFGRGLAYCLDIGIDLDHVAEWCSLGECHPNLYRAFGVYPSECQSEELVDRLRLLEEILAQTPRIVALGEIGLDFAREYGEVTAQVELLERQLQLAQRLRLPVIIHSRVSAPETLECLRRNRPSRGGVMHCFSYGEEWARQFMSLGFYISFAGNITYPKSHELRAALRATSIERLLIETDSPYLSPQKLRGKDNHPGHIGHTYEVIATELKLPLPELIEQVKSNFERCFAIGG